MKRGAAEKTPGCPHAWGVPDCPTCKAERAAALAHRTSEALQAGVHALCKAMARRAREQRMRVMSASFGTALRAVAALYECIESGEVTEERYGTVRCARALPWLSRSELDFVKLATRRMDFELHAPK